MNVFVVMGNDYPEAVFSTEESADAFCERKRAEEKQTFEREQPGKHFVRRINWRSYAFEMDGVLA